MPLDDEDIAEIVDAFLADSVTIPSDKLLRGLAKASGSDEGAIRRRFEQRSRAQGAETSLFDTMPFSGSG